MSGGRTPTVTRPTTPPALSFPDQCVVDGRVHVTVTTPATGVVGVVRSGSEVDPGDVPVLGASALVGPGRHEALPVSLDRSLPAETALTAVLLLDANGDDDPDFDGSDAVATVGSDRVTAPARVVPDCADCRADPPLVIRGVHPDAAGREDDSLGDEFVVLRHVGCRPVAADGWTLSFGAGDGQRWSFPDGTVLIPERTAVVATGTAGGPAADFVVGADGPILANRGDRVRLRDGTGVVVDEYTW